MLLLTSICRVLCLRVAFLLTLASISMAQADPLKIFDQNSFDQIESTYQGQPYIVAIWSLECPPCMKELKTLGQLKSEFPDFNLVLISTDDSSEMQEAADLLSSFALSNTDSWIFSGNQLERLRYSIDPNWYGEIPRQYFYANSRRTSSSGVARESLLRKWLIDTTD